MDLVVMEILEVVVMELVVMEILEEVVMDLVVMEIMEVVVMDLVVMEIMEVVVMELVVMEILKEVMLSDKNMKFKVLKALSDEFSHSVPNSMLHQMTSISAVCTFYQSPISSITPYDQ